MFSITSIIRRRRRRPPIEAQVEAQCDEIEYLGYVDGSYAGSSTGLVIIDDLVPEREMSARQWGAVARWYRERAETLSPEGLTPEAVAFKAESQRAAADPATPPDELLPGVDVALGDTRPGDLAVFDRSGRLRIRRLPTTGDAEA